MSEWQPIETAPKDGTWVLGWAPGWTVVTMAWCDIPLYPVSDKPYWAQGGAQRAVPATHWMPLPEPPK